VPTFVIPRFPFVFVQLIYLVSFVDPDLRDFPESSCEVSCGGQILFIDLDAHQLINGSVPVKLKGFRLVVTCYLLPDIQNLVFL
jgi:hypothetical protein